MTRSLAVAFIALIFIAGVAAGVAVDRLWLLPVDAGPPQAGRPGPPPHQRLFSELTDELDLTEAQQAKVTTLLDETRNKAIALMEASRPQLDAARDEAREKILTLLSEPQKARFLKLEEEAERRRPRRHRGPHGPQPHGPPPHGPPPHGPPPHGPPPHGPPPHAP